jgi:hypothetical protein
MNEIAIVTCITGGYDEPTDGFDNKDGFDYILLSEVPIPTKSWNNAIVKFGEGTNLSDCKKQRFIKTNIMDILSKYSVVVYIDANTDVNDKLYNYIEKYKDKPLTFKKHPDRDCIYDEIKECIRCGKESLEMGQYVYNFLKKEGYPEHNGLFETNIIVLQPGNERVKELFHNWSNEVLQRSKRDQFSINYVVWKLHMEDLITVSQTMDFKPKFHIRAKRN